MTGFGLRAAGNTVERSAQDADATGTDQVSFGAQIVPAIGASNGTS